LCATIPHFSRDKIISFSATKQTIIIVCFVGENIILWNCCVKRNKYFRPQNKPLLCRILSRGATPLSSTSSPGRLPHGPPAINGAGAESYTAKKLHTMHTMPHMLCQHKMIPITPFFGGKSDYAFFGVKCWGFKTQHDMSPHSIRSAARIRQNTVPTLCCDAKKRMATTN